MPEDTSLQQPDSQELAPESNDPEDINASADQESLSELRARLREESVKKARKELGDERYLNIVEHIQSELLRKVSEVDNRNYKDIDGFLKTFEARRNAYIEYEKLKKLQNSQPNSQQNQTQGDPSVQQINEQRETPPTQAVTPNGAVPLKDFNDYVMQNIVVSNPEFIFVKNEVEKVATDSNVSVLDVWNGVGKFKSYDFKAQAKYKESLRANESESISKNRPMPSKSGNPVPRQRVVPVDTFLEKDINQMTGKEIKDAINQGLVR